MKVEINLNKDGLLPKNAVDILRDRYMLPEEISPQESFARACMAFADNKAHAERLYKYVSNLWFMFASPLLSNGGTDRGLPISCFLNYVPDSRTGLSEHYTENIWLSSMGGGIGGYWGHIRSQGQSTSKGNKTTGVIPFMHVVDSQMVAFNQGSTRRGSYASYMDISHPEIIEFMEMRKPSGGDVNRKNLNLHHGVVIPDKFMKAVEGNLDWDLVDPNSKEIVKTVKARTLWIKLLETRVSTGEPYIMFSDNVNKDNPLAYRMNNLDVSMTNICTEITLHTDEEHSFICCLSSLNLAKYDEWKNTDVVETATYFLDGVMEEFIQKTNGKESMIRTHRSAKKGRALGLGVMGWHTFLQQKGLAFNSIGATAWTHTIFSDIKTKAEAASRNMAVEYGEPLWCKGTGMRNTHLLAIAPTVSNSRINSCSAGIEPQPANIYVFNGAKGTFIVKNPELEKLLEEKGHNTTRVWDQIMADNGSVMGLSGDILSEDEKEIFMTFPEINQLALVQQAATRQKYIDQTQSLNLAFDPTDSPRWINQVHMEAWKLGVKTLYYLRTDSVIKGDLGSRTTEDCLSCDG